MKRETKAYFEITLLIIISFSPLFSQPIKVIIAFILTLRNIKYLNKFDKSKGRIIFVFLMIFIISMVLDLRNINSFSQFNILNFYFPLCFLLGYTISKKFSLVEYLKYLEKIIFVFAIFSLIGVGVYTLFPEIVYRLPDYNYYYTSHKTAYIFNILTYSSGNIIRRNTGIAWEPGAFQFLLNLGLYAYIKLNPNRLSIKRLAIYSLAIIFTKSTAGLLIFVLITFKLFVEEKKVRPLIIVSLIIFGGLTYEEMVYHIQNKLFGSISFNQRLEPLINAFKVGKHYLFGIGNSGFDQIYLISNRPPYDSIGQIFIRYGYVLFTFLIIRMLRLLKDYKILFFVLLITFSSENIWFFPLVTPFYYIDKNSN